MVGGKGWGSPCDVPAGLLRVRGDSRGWWDSRNSIRGGAGDLPSPQHPATPPVSVFPVSLPFLVWLPSPLQIPALVLPRETHLLANRVVFCWLSSCQGLHGPLGEGRTWGRAIITSGGQLLTREAPGPQDVTGALVKAGGLKPTQASPSQGKGRSALNTGFVFRR